MKVIEADHERRYEMPGAAWTASKPVDISAKETGFHHLRSLRVYRFDAGVTIDGHAEDDEVFVVVTSGSVKMKIGWEDAAREQFGTFTLAAPDGASRAPSAAYLPPRSVYELTPQAAADVAYARARPVEARSPAVFGADISYEDDSNLLLQELAHADRLGLRIFRIGAQSGAVSIDVPAEADACCEALVHVQGSPADNVGFLSGPDATDVRLRSWQTLAFAPGERAVLHMAEGASALILTVLATEDRASSR